FLPDRDTPTPGSPTEILSLRRPGHTSNHLIQDCDTPHPDPQVRTNSSSEPAGSAPSNSAYEKSSWESFLPEITPRIHIAHSIRSSKHAKAPRIDTSYCRPT